MEIALNAESKRKTAVAVAITESTGERSFGGDALNICVKHPKSCYVYILELLGKKMDHPQVSTEVHRKYYARLRDPLTEAFTT